MKELGFYTPVTPITNREAIEMAIDETYIPFGEKTTVLDWFGNILGESLVNNPLSGTLERGQGGEAVSLAISYDSDPSYPVMILQEMLVRSGIGKIMDGMTLSSKSSSPSNAATSTGTPSKPSGASTKACVPVTARMNGHSIKSC